MIVPGCAVQEGFDGGEEQIVFPEINYDKIDTIRGMDIIIATTAKSNEEAKALLKAFNIPFAN